MKFLALLILLCSALSASAAVEKLRPRNRVFACGPFVFATQDESRPQGYGYDLRENERLSFLRTGEQVTIFPFFYGDWPSREGWTGAHYPYLKEFYLFKKVETRPSFADPAFEIRYYGVSHIHQIRIELPTDTYRCLEEPVQDLFEALKADDQSQIEKLGKSVSFVSHALVFPTAIELGHLSFVQKYLGRMRNKMEVAQELLLRARDAKTAKMLIDFGADPNKKISNKSYSSSLLTLAVLDGNYDLAEALVEKGAKAEQLDMGLLFRLKMEGYDIDILRAFKFKESKLQSLDIFASIYNKCDPRLHKTYCQSFVKNFHLADSQNSGTFEYAVHLNDMELLKYLVSKMKTMDPGGLVDGLYVAGSLLREDMLQYLMKEYSPKKEILLTVSQKIVSQSFSACLNPSAFNDVYDDYSMCPSEDQFKFVLKKYFLQSGIPDVETVRAVQVMRFLIESGANINTSRHPGTVPLLQLLSMLGSRNRLISENAFTLYVSLVSELMNQGHLQLDMKDSTSMNVFDHVFDSYRLHSGNSNRQKDLIGILEKILKHRNVNRSLKNKKGETPKVSSCNEAKTDPAFVQVCAMF